MQSKENPTDLQWFLVFSITFTFMNRDYGTTPSFAYIAVNFQKDGT